MGCLPSHSCYSRAVILSDTDLRIIPATELSAVLDIIRRRAPSYEADLLTIVPSYSNYIFAIGPNGNWIYERHPGFHRSDSPLRHHVKIKNLGTLDEIVLSFLQWAAIARVLQNLVET